MTEAIMVAVDKERLGKACQLLVSHAKAKNITAWLDVISHLRSFGWLDEMSVADAVLLAPIAWCREAGLTVRLGGGAYEVPPEDLDLLESTLDALRAFRAEGEQAEIIQLRDFARGRWRVMDKGEEGDGGR